MLNQNNTTLNISVIISSMIGAASVASLYICSAVFWMSPVIFFEIALFVIGLFLMAALSFFAVGLYPNMYPGLENHKGNGLYCFALGSFCLSLIPAFYFCPPIAVMLLGCGLTFAGGFYGMLFYSGISSFFNKNSTDNQEGLSKIDVSVHTINPIEGNIRNNDSYLKLFDSKDEDNDSIDITPRGSLSVFL